MNALIEGPSPPLRGTARLPGDKSISHRAAIVAALSGGTSVLRNFATGRDTERTVACLRALGVTTKVAERADAPWTGDTLSVTGRGREGFDEPSDVLDCGNSGTTMRLLCGLLAAQPFFSVLTGDESLRSRPMARVTRPLSSMGASIMARAGGGLPPVAIEGRDLSARDFDLEVASAQVKSCLLLAGLFAKGVTRVTEPALSRDHTERILRLAGVRVRESIGPEGSHAVWLEGCGGASAWPGLPPLDLAIPGDASTASFLMAAAAMIPGSEVKLKDVGVNPTRTGFMEALRDMAVDLAIESGRESSWEPVADLTVAAADGPTRLRPVSIFGEAVARTVDELPLVAVLATQAEGRTIIEDAAELRVKETDRLRAMALNLSVMGAEVRETRSGLYVEGPVDLKGAAVDSFGDHRVAMAMAVAGLAARGKTVIRGAECVDVSCPGFFEILSRLGASCRLE